MRHAIAEASQAAHLAIASFQLEAAVCEELHHERDHVDVGDHAQQLKVETLVVWYLNWITAHIYDEPQWHLFS